MNVVKAKKTADSFGRCDIRNGPADWRRMRDIWSAFRRRNVQEGVNPHAHIEEVCKPL